MATCGHSVRRCGRARGCERPYRLFAGKQVWMGWRCVSRARESDARRRGAGARAVAERAEDHGIIGCRLAPIRSEEHTSELQSLMRISYAVFCLKKKTYSQQKQLNIIIIHNLTQHEYHSHK